MKLPKPAPETPDVVAIRAAELAAIRAEITAAEAALPALAESDDDEKFESVSLTIERLKRSELRAAKRLEAAQTAHAEAEAREERDRRRALYAAGTKAHAEAEKLAGTYAEHAAVISEILRAIDKLRPPVEAANTNLPEGERTIDVHAFEIYRGAALPAATKDGPKFWWRPDYYGFDPLNPPPPHHSPGHILIDGVCVLFDEANPAHITARHARPSMAQPPASKPASRPVSEFGERTLPDGTRKIALPPNQWPPKPASAFN